MKRVAIVIYVLLFAAGCKREPKPYTAAGYTFTLPGGWDGKLEHKRGFENIVFSAFADNVACLAQIVPGASHPDVFFSQFVADYHATDVTPATLETPMGAFQGQKFLAHQTSKNPLVKIALAMGDPHGEVYAMRDNGGLVLLFLLTPGAPEHQASAREHCAAILSTIRRESADAH